MKVISNEMKSISNETKVISNEMKVISNEMDFPTRVYYYYRYIRTNNIRILIN
jgi:hypothetical protein